MEQREIIVEHQYIDGRLYHCFDDKNYELLLLERQVYTNENEQLRAIIKEVREYITSYESISTIQGLNNLELLNDGLDYKTIEEMTNRYFKVHDKILEILDKVSDK